MALGYNWLNFLEKNVFIEFLLCQSWSMVLPGGSSPNAAWHFALGNYRGSTSVCLWSLIDEASCRNVPEVFRRSKTEGCNRSNSLRRLPSRTRGQIFDEIRVRVRCRCRHRVWNRNNVSLFGWESVTHTSHDLDSYFRSVKTITVGSIVTN